jgi:hypothetical protein
VEGWLHQCTSGTVIPIITLILYIVPKWFEYDNNYDYNLVKKNQNGKHVKCGK